MVNTEIRQTIYFAAEHGEALHSKKKKKKEKERKEKILGADYGSGHDLLIAKFRLKLKKVKKKTLGHSGMT